MLSKRLGSVAIILGCLASSCSLPWSGDLSHEANVAFRWKNNLIFIDGSVDSKPATFLVGTAQPRSVIDPKFREDTGEPVNVSLGHRYSKPISPAGADLKGLADGILGADMWEGSTLTLDYSRQLAILSRDRADNLGGALYRFDGPPAVPITINGQSGRAIIDATIPDSLILPANGRSGRETAAVRIGEFDLGRVDVVFGETSMPRIGNRLLSRFLIRIDYDGGTVWLWRDPRRP